MILTPQDIQSQQFHVRFRGFDVEEVDDFLEKIAAAFQAVAEENQQLKGRLEAMEKDLSTYQNQQKSFQSAIIAAQNVADAMKEKSREEAEAIVGEAREEARLGREEAKREIADLKKNIDHLKSLKQQAADDLRHQLESYLQMLETEPVENTRAMDHFRSASRQPASREPASRQQTPQHGNILGAVPLGQTTDEPETGWSRQESNPATSEEIDLADLYVKIDIPDSGPENELAQTETDTFSFEDIALAAASPAGNDIRFMDDDAENLLPDLDGDMIFNLDDPLEDNEPAVSFAENLDEAKNKKPDRFNPDESPL
jgi:cell division initiation protein